jgi:hypothetical protein
LIGLLGTLEQQMTDVKLYRNIAITTRFLNGERLSDLAREHEVTNERVRQIVKQYCRKANKQWYSSMPPGPPCPDFEWLRQHRQVFIEDMHKLVPNV